MPRSSRWICVTLSALATVCLSSQHAKADGVILNGVSAVSIGRGGANIAFADNGSILHDNPASMGFLEGESMFQIGSTALFTDFSYTDPDNATSAQTQVYPLPELSYIKRLSDRWVAGLGVFGPAGFGAIFNLNGQPPFAGLQQYKSFGSLSKLLLGLSAAPSEFVSVGATIGPGLSFVDLKGPYTLQGFGLPTLLDMNVDGWGLVWSSGVTVQLTGTTTVGASFQSQSKIQASGTASVISPIGSGIYQVDADVVWPRSAGAGLRQKIGRQHVLATDVIWYDWSDAFDTFDISLFGSTNPGLPNIFEQFPLLWHDTVSTRLGYEFHRDNGHIARAGYTHHKSPIPAETITPYVPAALEHAFSLGYGLMCRDWQVNLAYMFTFGPTVRTQTSTLVGGDFDQSIHSDRTHAMAISFTRILGACQHCRSRTR